MDPVEAARQAALYERRPEFVALMQPHPMKKLSPHLLLLLLLCVVAAVCCCRCLLQLLLLLLLFRRCGNVCCR
jgi:hypothetical protein